jgi:hypothetical protein
MIWSMINILDLVDAVMMLSSQLMVGTVRSTHQLAVAFG